MKSWSKLIPWKWVGSEEVIPGRVAFDAPNYLAARTSVLKPSRSNNGRIPLQQIGLVLSIVRSCLKSHALPVLVFDGLPERMKRDPNPDLRQRAQILYRQFVTSGDPFDESISEELWNSPALRTYFIGEHVRDLARSMGVPVLTAPSEAEMYAAVLCREGIATTVVSSDSDALLYGSPHVTRQLQLSRQSICRATLGDLEANVGLDLEGLRDLAIVCGCDFHREGVKGIGPRRGAMMLERFGSLDALLKSRGYSHSEREYFILARQAFDEVNYVSPVDLNPTLDPPIISKFVSLLGAIMSEERAGILAQRQVNLWRNFRIRQETLEQWL